jgi:hypothetical protein
MITADTTLSYWLTELVGDGPLTPDLESEARHYALIDYLEQRHPINTSVQRFADYTDDDLEYLGDLLTFALEEMVNRIQQGDTEAVQDIRGHIIEQMTVIRDAGKQQSARRITDSPEEIGKTLLASARNGTTRADSIATLANKFNVTADAVNRYLREGLSEQRLDELNTEIQKTSLVARLMQGNWDNWTQARQRLNLSKFFSKEELDNLKTQFKQRNSRLKRYLK